MIFDAILSGIIAAHIVISAARILRGTMSTFLIFIVLSSEKTNLVFAFRQPFHGQDGIN